MADTKVSALTELTAPALTDMMYVVDDEVTDLSKRMTIATLRTFIGREVLTANRTYYVRTDGSDSNTGLADSAGGAFLTWQAAFNLVRSTLDFAGYRVTLQVGGSGSRTFSTSNVNVVQITPWVGGGELAIQGDLDTPSEVTLTSNRNLIATAGLLPGKIYIDGFTYETTGVAAAGCIFHAGVGQVFIGYNGANIFGSCVGPHLYSFGPANYMELTGTVSITGGALRHIQVVAGGHVYMDADVTVSASLTFTTFALVGQLSFLEAYCTYSTNVATGKRFDAGEGGVIADYAGATYFPGNSAGTGTDFGTDPWGLHV